MPGIKTAISLNKELFHKIDKIAHDMNISRSRLFSIAVQEYLEKLENQSLLARINEAYSEPSNEEDDFISQAMRKKHRKIVGCDSWK